MKNSICNKCSSCGYCANRESGMMACNNFNKFPKEADDETTYTTNRSHRKRTKV